MYETAESEIDRIVSLVDRCPEPYRARAFEILLEGYVRSLQTPAPSAGGGQSAGAHPPPPPPGADRLDPAVPAEIQARMHAVAKRKNVSPVQLAALFDFSMDPFVFAPIHVPGKNNAERTRKVALLVAARAFLASARWVADWAEIKAMCTHQACYDLANFARVLNNAEGTLFKKVNGGVSAELSAQGITEAESLLATLASGTNASEE